MINLHYIGAAIEQNTGVRLPLPRIRELLVEEGLITQAQADRDAKLFVGYAEYFDLVDPGNRTRGGCEEGLSDDDLPNTEEPTHGQNHQLLREVP